MGAMTSRIASIVIDARQPDVVAGFWCEVLGWRVLETEDGLVSIGPADGSWPTIDVIAVPEPKAVKNRVHIDLRADDTTTPLELTRLLELGAVRTDVGQGSDVSWFVLADPEGNEFCLLSRTVTEVVTDPVP